MRSTRSQLGGVLFPPLPLLNISVTDEGLSPRRVASFFFCTPARVTSSLSAPMNSASRSIASRSATAGLPGLQHFDTFGAPLVSVPPHLACSSRRFGYFG